MFTHKCTPKPGCDFYCIALPGSRSADCVLGFLMEAMVSARLFVHRAAACPYDRRGEDPGTTTVLINGQ